MIINYLIHYLLRNRLRTFFELTAKNRVNCIYNLKSQVQIVTSYNENCYMYFQLLKVDKKAMHSFGSFSYVGQHLLAVKVNLFQHRMEATGEQLTYKHLVTYSTLLFYFFNNA